MKLKTRTIKLWEKGMSKRAISLKVNCQRSYVQTIIKEIQAGKLSRMNDEKCAGGFWDLAGELSEGSETIQDSVYEALWELYESLT
jgi:hypothetical protein